MHFDQQKWVLPIKIVALALLVLLAPWGWLDLIWRRIVQLQFDGRGTQLVRYVVIIAAMFAGMAIVSILKDSRVRIAITIMFAAGFIADQIVLTLTNQHSSIELVQVLWSERASAADATQNYLLPILKILCWTIPLFCALAMAPPANVALGIRYALIPLVGFIAAPINIRITTSRIDEYPSTYSVAAQLVYVLLTKQPFAGPRQDVAYADVPERKFEKIVFIVDESIRSDYLQINNNRFNNTPYLAKEAGRYVNFGNAVSGANASTSARLILRSGLRIDQLPDVAQLGMHRATVWQFAKKAGMRTVYIDAWRPEGEMHSFMNAHEFQFIDRHIPTRDGAKSLIDARVADRIKEELATPGPEFIFVEKLGSHFPYSQTVPPESSFEPSGVDALPAASNPAHKVVLQQYMRSTRRSVDDFFAVLLPLLINPETLVIYTSDHGQSLFEGGYEATHGSIVDVHPGESRVPLLVFTGNASFAEKLEQSAQASKDRASHFDIFPTLLLAMGFNSEWILATYGNTLLSLPVGRQRRYLIGNVFGGSRSKMLNAD